MFIIPKITMDLPCSKTNEAHEKTVEALIVNIAYQMMKSNALVEAISQLRKPEVIFWYIGVYGLREEGVKYYRKELSKILLTSDASCQLYDLTAWIPFAPGIKNGNLESFNQNG